MLSNAFRETWKPRRAAFRVKNEIAILRVKIPENES